MRWRLRQPGRPSVPAETGDRAARSVAIVASLARVEVLRGSSPRVPVQETRHDDFPRPLEGTGIWPRGWRVDGHRLDLRPRRRTRQQRPRSSRIGPPSTATTSFEDVLDTNVRGPFLLKRVAAAGVIERESGVIINVGSLRCLPRLRTHDAPFRQQASLTVASSGEDRSRTFDPGKSFGRSPRWSLRVNSCLGT